MENNPPANRGQSFWSRLTNISQSTCILLGLILGVAAGLFFGPMVRSLDFIGKAFIKLLQMAVLPYIVVSLIHGLGCLSRSDSQLIATKGYKILLFLWTVGLLVIFVFPLAFPEVETSAFFSEADTLPPKKIDFLNIYIPSNIFQALAQGTVPAIVVFCVFLGFALNSIDNKETFLNVFAVLSKALARVTQMIIKIAPLGVFALTAVAAGTLTFDQMQRLQVYFVSYFFITLLFTFAVLPAIIGCFTPFSYRQIIHYSKDALILGFATGNNFVVLPLISSKSIELLQKADQEDTAPNGGRKISTIVDSVVPLAYCFPSLGRILDIFFIVFVAWSVNFPLGIIQYLDLAVAGIMSLFGSPKVAVPFLLDYFKLPASYFDLYIISDVVTRKFKVMVQVMSFQTVTLILTYLLVKPFSLQFTRIAKALVANLLLLAASLGMVAVGLNYIVKNVYYENIVLMSMKVADPVPAKVWRSPPGPGEEPMPAADNAGGALAGIQRRGVLRVGYNPENLPFAFFNQEGELVGYDIFFAHRLARDLGVTLALIPVTSATLRSCLDQGACDIVMSGIPITAAALGKLNFSEPYMNENAAFVVLDRRKKAFRTTKAVARIPNLRLAVTPANPPAERLLLKKQFPNAQVVELASIQDFFTKPDAADALLTTDKIGKAWALLYPKFGVATPHPVMFQYDLAYPVAITKGDHAFLDYLNQWLRLQKTSGVVQTQFSYWVLGQTPLRHHPRWSIIRNVLHWVN